MELTDLVVTVENGIRLLGIKPEEVRMQEYAHWSLSRGSAEILMFLRTSEGLAGQKDALVIMARIMELPASKREALFQSALQYNFTFVNESFCIKDNVLYLKTSRFAHGVDPEEVMILLDNLSAIADFLDDKLKEEFKGFSVN